MATSINVITADNAQVKAKISETVTGFKNSQKAFASLFLDLCVRFTEKDKMSGDMLAHLLNQLGEDQKAIRGRIALRLREWSESKLLVEFDEATQLFSVKTKKDVAGKSEFEKAVFDKNVQAAKKATNALTYSPEKEGETPKPKRFNVSKAEAKMADNLKEFASKLMEAEKLSPEALAVKLEAMLKLVLLDVKPVIEAEPVSQEASPNSQA